MKEEVRYDMHPYCELNTIDYKKPTLPTEKQKPDPNSD